MRFDNDILFLEIPHCCYHSKKKKKDRNKRKAFKSLREKQNIFEILFFKWLAGAMQENPI